MSQLNFQFEKDQPRPRFPKIEPKRMTRITWRTLPSRGEDKIYRGRITMYSERFLQAIITHTPYGYDLGWHRLINPAEVIKIKR